MEPTTDGLVRRVSVWRSQTSSCASRAGRADLSPSCPPRDADARVAALLLRGDAAYYAGDTLTGRQRSGVLHRRSRACAGAGRAACSRGLSVRHDRAQTRARSFRFAQRCREIPFAGCARARLELALRRAPIARKPPAPRRVITPFRTHANATSRGSTGRSSCCGWATRPAPKPRLRWIRGAVSAAIGRAQAGTRCRGPGPPVLTFD